MTLKRVVVTCLLICSTFVIQAAPAPAGKKLDCSMHNGEQFIICRETGGFRKKFMADRAPHYPGTGQTASGPYGLLRGTRADYNCGNVSDRVCAQRYLDAVYDGSWAKAEARAKRDGFW